MNYSIQKASGEVANFSEKKLRQSLKRSGAEDPLIENVMDLVMEKLYDGMSTQTIYKIAFDGLKKISGHFAGRYHLKRAIMELGPSGYPFEKFVAEILSAQGFKTKVGQIVQGICVSHEIDVIAELNDQHYMIECKYHNQPGIISNIKIPLYIQARFKDVESAWTALPGHSTKFHMGWVFTNTRFSSDAIAYGKCVGLKLIGWNYPEGGSLRYQIDTHGLYPVTCLTSLTKAEKQFLLARNIVLCRELCKAPTLLKVLGLSEIRQKKVLHEGEALCKTLKDNGSH